MIKGLHEITIADFDLMEQTGRISQFKKRWNILPSFLFVKQISGLVTEIVKKLDSENINKDDNLLYKTRSLLKIQRIEASYFIVINELFTNIPVNQLSKMVNLKKKLKESKNNSLKIALSEIEILTGLKVGNEIYKDLEEIRLEIIRLKDKYNENFKEEKKVNQDKISLLDFAGGYADYYGIDINGLSQMIIPELILLKKKAEQRYKREQQQLNALKNGRN